MVDHEVTKELCMRSNELWDNVVRLRKESDSYQKQSGEIVKNIYKMFGDLGSLIIDEDKIVGYTYNGESILLTQKEK